MMSRVVVVLALVLVAGAFANDKFESEPRTTFQVDTPSDHWKLLSPVEQGVTLSMVEPKMTVYFMLKHCRKAVAKLEEKLFDISNPTHESYGKHLSLEELKALTPIPKETITLLTEFITQYNTQLNKEYHTRVSVNHNQDIIEATMLVKTAERLFKTKIGRFTAQHNAKSRFTLFRAIEEFSLPSSVAQVVDTVGDLHLLPSIRTLLQEDYTMQYNALQGRGQWPNDCPDLWTCNGLITPGVLKKRYNIEAAQSEIQYNTEGLEESVVAARKLVSEKKNGMAVAEFQGQFFSTADLRKFSSACGVNVTVDKIIGGDIEVAGIESMLDIEYIKALAPEIPLAFIYSAQYSLFNWANQISNDPEPQWVHSVSYGNDEKQQVTDEYIFSVNVQLMKAGARGLSILFASGDQGVCGREGCGIFPRSFKPDFPAASPYVTSVGGTDFVSTSIGEEQAWSCGGGGFSNHFPIPSYQSKAVKNYINNPAANLPNKNLWNQTARGYPDIAALGGQKTPYCVLAKGMAVGVAGTSASCPVAAAIFAKLNGVRFKQNKGPLGFLNPFIYQNADAFNDVTKGQNGCSMFTKGFNAIEGWDPATGVGTPNYMELKSRVEALP